MVVCMAPIWTPLDPYVWQAWGESLWALAREFFRKKPVAASATAAGVTVVLVFVLLKLASFSAALIPKAKAAEPTEVSGVLRVDGVPVSEGVIQFLPKRQRPPVMTIIRNGEFKSQDVEAGQYRVICFATREEVDKKKKKKGKEERDAIPKRISVIPEKYRDGVELDLQTGKNELVLEWHND